MNAWSPRKKDVQPKKVDVFITPISSSLIQTLPLLDALKMAPPTLLGPPEIYKSTPNSRSEDPPASGDPFVDLMVANFNSISRPPMGRTENFSPTFLSSGNPCLDFFFHVVPNTPPESLTLRLSAAWAHDPLTTLKLVCNLRGVRGKGKSDKEGFYSAALWLHKHHPKTLACNVPSMAGFGYFKDLPEILYRILQGPDVRRIERKGSKLPRFATGRRGRSNSGRKVNTKRAQPSSSVRSGVSGAIEGLTNEKEEASLCRKEKRVAMAKKVVERFARDPDFRFLYDRVADFFAEGLVNGLQLLKAGKSKNISLAAKWCPSIDSSFDRSTLLCESIARKVFPIESYPEYEGIEDAHYAYRIRDRLRKEVLVPLREVLELPEVFIGANRWDLIPYNRVASVAMKFYKEKFMKHDKDRFEKYLEDVKTGKSKIAAGALLPHEIIDSLTDLEGKQVAELQWKRMVDDLLNHGKMRNCIAVCDVSGSMHGIPMDVCVALGLLVSELSEEPWKGKVITFSMNPQLHVIQGSSLEEKVEFVKEMEWGMNTDFQKVFDLILKVAVNGGLKSEQMIKRVFVFSDMEFDQASENRWETDYEAIVRKFGERGYGSAVPEIVFWNLRYSRATPVPGSQQGVALVSGFSKNLMKLFMDNDGTMSPEAVMEVAISGKEYEKLVVLD